LVGWLLVLHIAVLGGPIIIGANNNGKSRSYFWACIWLRPFDRLCWSFAPAAAARRRLARTPHGPAPSAHLTKPTEFETKPVFRHTYLPVDCAVTTAAASVVRYFCSSDL